MPEMTIAVRVAVNELRAMHPHDLAQTEVLRIGTPDWGGSPGGLWLAGVRDDLVKEIEERGEFPHPEEVHEFLQAASERVSESRVWYVFGELEVYLTDEAAEKRELTSDAAYRVLDQLGEKLARQLILEHTPSPVGEAG